MQPFAPFERATLDTLCTVCTICTTCTVCHPCTRCTLATAQQQYPPEQAAIVTALCEGIGALLPTYRAIGDGGDTQADAIRTELGLFLREVMTRASPPPLRPHYILRSMVCSALPSPFDVCITLEVISRCESSLRFLFRSVNVAALPIVPASICTAMLQTGHSCGAVWGCAGLCGAVRGCAGLCGAVRVCTAPRCGTPARHIGGLHKCEPSRHPCFAA
jgi:hypothetical protein